MDCVVNCIKPDRQAGSSQFADRILETLINSSQLSTILGNFLSEWWVATHGPRQGWNDQIIVVWKCLLVDIKL